MSPPGACEAEAVLTRLVGQVVTQKHEGKPFTSMQGRPAVRVFHTGGSGLETVPSGGLQQADVSSEPTHPTVLSLGSH